MADATFETPDLTTFARLDTLGLQVTGQFPEPDCAVLVCRVADGDQICRRCGEQGRPRDSTTRRLAHEAFGWRPTVLLVTVRRYRCGLAWRQDTSAAAEPRARLSRGGLRRPGGVAACDVILDRFHLVALANRAVTDHRRELAWTNRGRRGRKVDPEWAQTQPFAARRRTPDQGGVGEDEPGDEDRRPTRLPAEVLAGKELLRNLLTLAGTDPDWALVWRRLTDFQIFCADHIQIQQIRRLTQPPTTGGPGIIEGIFTGISNGRSEGYNRIVKHIGRIAFGSRNPTNQKRRIRFACTGASGRVTTTLKPCLRMKTRNDACSLHGAPPAIDAGPDVGDPQAQLGGGAFIVGDPRPVDLPRPGRRPARAAPGGPPGRRTLPVRHQRRGSRRSVPVTARWRWTGPFVVEKEGRSVLVKHRQDSAGVARHHRPCRCHRGVVIICRSAWAADQSATGSVPGAVRPVSSRARFSESSCMT